MLLAEFGCCPKGPTKLFCDNTGARAVAEDPRSEKSLKHVARRHFFVQDLVKAGEIAVPGVASHNNMADLLTKVIHSTPRFEFLASMYRSWTTAT